MTRRLDTAEALANVSVGYVLAVATQVLVFPLFGLEAAPVEHLGIAAVFTSVSLVRSYCVRRIFRRIGNV